MGSDHSYKSSRRSSHVSTGHLVAPPNTSTLLSTQGMMLPGMLIEQLAIFMMSSALKTLSHILNWLISPTKAWVASNLPPTVSFRHMRVRIRWDYFGIFLFKLEVPPHPALLLERGADFSHRGEQIWVSTRATLNKEFSDKLQPKLCQSSWGKTVVTAKHHRKAVHNQPCPQAVEQEGSFKLRG